MRKAISNNDGNFEKAMESCGNFVTNDFTSWAGKGRKKVNRLIQSTAEWAGFNSEEAKKVVDLTKALIGDEIVKKGGIEIDWGPHRMQFTPRTYLIDLKNAKYKALCQELLPKVLKRRNPTTEQISDRKLKDVSGNNNPVIDRQTLMSLAYLPYKRRKIACRKLSEALALGNYTDDMAKSLDFIAGKIGSNPNLPTKNKIQSPSESLLKKPQNRILSTF